MEGDKWTDILGIDEFKELYQWPGIIKIRLADSAGHPFEIGRFLGNDKEGLLVIEHSGDVAKRLTAFYRDYRDFKEIGHYEATRLNEVRKYTAFGKAIFVNYKIQFSALKLKDEQEAKRQEEQLLREYFKKYGALPPLNSAMPNRYGWRALIDKTVE